jgi:hypothetical protein
MSSAASSIRAPDRSRLRFLTGRQHCHAAGRRVRARRRAPSLGEFRGRANRSPQSSLDERDVTARERTASLMRADEQLEAGVAERKRSEQRLMAEHAVTRGLAESVTLTEAAPQLLRAIGDDH